MSLVLLTGEVPYLLPWPWMTPLALTNQAHSASQIERLVFHLIYHVHSQQITPAQHHNPQQALLLSKVKQGIPHHRHPLHTHHQSHSRTQQARHRMQVRASRCRQYSQRWPTWQVFRRLRSTSRIPLSWLGSPNYRSRR